MIVFRWTVVILVIQRCVAVVFWAREDKYK